MTAANPTVATLRRRIAAHLEEAFAARGAEGTAALDARLLVAHALGIDGASLVLVDRDPVTPLGERTALTLAERRAAGEPVARIIGEREFWSLHLRVSPDTLDPRPDTETIVCAALKTLERDGRTRDPLAILDLGTGTGAILLALLSELPLASGVGVDRSEGAARTAFDNAARLGLRSRTAFVVGDWDSALAGQFDAVVSNPPYIRTGDIADLPLEVRGHDPHLALDGGVDGLIAIRAVLPVIVRSLTPKGRAFVEIGAGQAGEVIELAAQMGLEPIRHSDLSGVQRVIELRRIGENRKLPRETAIGEKKWLGNPVRTG